MFKGFLGLDLAWISFLLHSANLLRFFSLGLLLFLILVSFCFSPTETPAQRFPPHLKSLLSSSPVATSAQPLPARPASASSGSSGGGGGPAGGGGTAGQQKKTCPYCFQQLSWHALSRHIRDMHRAKTGFVKCNFCNKMFRNKNSLGCHMWRFHKEQRQSQDHPKDHEQHDLGGGAGGGGGSGGEMPAPAGVAAASDA